MKDSREEEGIPCFKYIIYVSSLKAVFSLFFIFSLFTILRSLHHHHHHRSLLSSRFFHLSLSLSLSTS
ncbi:hypothetical protein CMV_025353 [Castanea mollissima]|uniref:Uncharacterized protein n=1 Tax=Castanea mollissima TaxID=60419 RepID=A0A8J4QEN6_9ROSI|nr:hypothetical protein CMV_025353 [Castanea mollissima]